MLLFFIDVAMCDLMHDAEAMFRLSWPQTASGILFSEIWMMPEKRQIAVSRASLIFQILSDKLDLS